MNKFLVNKLSELNGVLALTIVFSLTIAGFMLTQGNLIAAIFGAFAGAIIGCIIAVIFCGLIAYLVIIEKHLSIIASQAAVKSDHPKV